MPKMSTSWVGCTNVTDDRQTDDTRQTELRSHIANVNVSSRPLEVFVKDEAEISSRVGGVKWRVVYFGKLVFEFDEQEFSLRGFKSQKISSHPGRNVLKSISKVRYAWVKVEWMEREEELSIIFLIYLFTYLLRSLTYYALCGVFVLICLADRQTHRQTDREAYTQTNSIKNKFVQQNYTKADRLTRSHSEHYTLIHKQFWLHTTVHEYMKIPLFCFT